MWPSEAKYRAITTLPVDVQAHFFSSSSDECRAKYNAGIALYSDNASKHLSEEYFQTLLLAEYGTFRNAYNRLCHYFTYVEDDQIPRADGLPPQRPRLNVEFEYRHPIITPEGMDNGNFWCAVNEFEDGNPYNDHTVADAYNWECPLGHWNRFQRRLKDKSDAHIKALCTNRSDDVDRLIAEPAQ